MENGDSPMRDQLMKEAQALADRASKRLTILEAQRQAIDEEVKWLKTYIRNVSPETDVPAKIPQRHNLRTVQNTKRPSNKTLIAVADAIMVVAEEHPRFDVYQVSEQMGASGEDTARRAFVWLRELEFIARAGEEHINEKRMGMTRKKFSLDRGEVLAELRRAAS